MTALQIYDTPIPLKSIYMNMKDVIYKIIFMSLSFKITMMMIFSCSSKKFLVLFVSVFGKLSEDFFPSWDTLQTIRPILENYFGHNTMEIMILKLERPDV